MLRQWPQLTTTMTDRTKTAIQFWLGLGAMLVTLTLAWSGLNAQVERLGDTKADRTELQDLRQFLTRIDDRTADLWDAECRRAPRQLGCSRSSRTTQP